MSMAAEPKKRKNPARRTCIWVFGVLFVLISALLIHYRGVRPVLRVEYGTTPCASDLTKRDAELILKEEKPSRGWHFCNLSIGGVPTPVLLHVVDTIAPSAEAVNRTVPLGTELGPDAFVKHVKDADTVRAAFEEVPDFHHEWDGTIRIVLTDGAKNETVIPVQISVRATVASLTVEAGSDIPGPEAFLLDSVNGVQTTVISPEMLHHAGTYPVAFAIDGGIVSQSQLIVADTAAPQASPTLRLIAPGETADPATLVENASDETDLIYTFVTAPDYDCRDRQKVVVRLTDEGGNTLDVESTLLITGVRPRMIEARREALTPNDFENADGQRITVERFIPDTPGTYAVAITVNGIPETLAVTVTDTTPPTVTRKQPEDVVLYTRHAYLPEDFFEAEDLTPVTMSFVGNPDLDLPGEQTITVCAKDSCGNETQASCTITLVEDRNPPHIYGVINRITYVEEPIAYLAEVFAEDGEDGPVRVTVRSEVLLYQEGTYQVVYRAEDRSGNVSEQTCTYTLIQRTVTEEELKALMQSILAEITTPDMVDAEKLKAIFDYVQTHVRYANGVNNNYTDWRKAAYDGYMQGTGDCYNIYSLTRALLDETGIRYLSVERVRTYTRRTRHYWVMVNLGTGWYVFDPTWTPKHRFICFMWTKAQCNSCYLYWYYRESDYPPLATERFDYEAVVEMERSGTLP